jgi:hypothetical protein
VKRRRAKWAATPAPIFFVESPSVSNPNANSPPAALSKTDALDFFRDLDVPDSARNTSEMPSEIRRSHARHRQAADRFRMPS